MVEIKRWEVDDHWVEVDLDRCIGAGECIAVCPAEVYDLVNGKVVAANIGDCIACMACEGVCPTKSILKHSAWD